jgi:hypothetical protein
MGFESIALAEVDAATRTGLRTLLQFRNSPVFHQVLGAFAAELQELFDALFDVIQLRGPADAQGVCLDALARIVGQGRDLIDWSGRTWLTPDVDYKGPDQVPVWVENAALGDSFAADDVLLRDLMLGKVARNHTKYGSVPEIQNAVRQAFSLDVSVVWVAPLVVDVVVSDEASQSVLDFLARVGNTRTADQVYWLPIPAGVDVNQVARVSDYVSS